MAQAIKGAITSHLRVLYQCRSRLMCNYSRTSQSIDLANKYLQSGDLLLSSLKNATSTKTVLEVVSQHNKIMNNKHILQALRSLFTLQKHGNSDLSTNQILEHRDFRKLCHQLRYQAGTIDLRDTIEALKIVSYVGVPADSTIFQVLLQLIRYNINNMSLQQIMFLDFLLQQSKSTPLVDALRLALPIVFEIQLPVKLEYDNMGNLADCLYFASSHRICEDAVGKIVNALMSYHEFDPKTAKSLVWSMCELPSSELFRPLMKKALDALVLHFHDCSFTDMETTLSKLIGKYSRKCDYCYDDIFYDSVANAVVDKDLGYKQSIYILRKFGRLSYFHKSLLDYMSTKIHENPEMIPNIDPLDIYSIAVSTALTDYRPVHWDTVKAVISKSENIAQSDKKEIIWLKFAAALCVLEIFRLDVLTKCLNEAFLDSLFQSKRFMSDFENYATIWQCIKMFKPDLNCLLTPRFHPEVLIKNFRQQLDFPLEAALHKVLGGEKYVETDLYSRMGHQIDHVVVFRKGGYPVAMNYSDSIEFVEDIEVTADNQLVIILGLRHYSYTLNSRELKGNTLVGIKSLETKGYQVVPVYLEVWENLADFEKIPYLMQAIKEHTATDLNGSHVI